MSNPSTSSRSTRSEPTARQQRVKSVGGSHRRRGCIRRSRSATDSSLQCNSRRGELRRLGAATAELAMILPVLMTLVLGTLEICQRLLLKQSVTVAAYESVRLAARRTVTADQAIARGQSILEGRRVNGGTVEILPAGLDTLATGEQIDVFVRVPVEGNTMLQYLLPVDGQIEVSATMLRE